MESQMMFLDCPAYLDEHGAQRCGLPAEARDWFTMRSTSGPSMREDPLPVRPLVPRATRIPYKYTNGFGQVACGVSTEDCVTVGAASKP
jgi:hypothetical protein